MKDTFILSEDGSPEITPSSTSAQTDFDFYIGNWNIRNRKLKKRLAACSEWTEFDSTDETIHLIGGKGNLNKFRADFNGESFEGMALRLFNPQTRLWSIYWADSNSGALDPPMVGSFDGNAGKFYCKDIFEGKSILVLFHWDKSDPDNPVWSQAFSADGGKSWEWNWYMYASRIR